jgi:hypothetical protein
MLEGIKVPIKIDKVLGDEAKTKEFIERAQKNLQK